MSNLDESFELDANTIFKQEADQLTTVQNLEDALSRFGFTKDDKITRRELVTIHNAVRDAMEPEIFHLANTARYAEAKEMRARLDNIRGEFDGLQLNGAARIRAEQQNMFEKASKEMMDKLATVHEQKVETLRRTFEEQESKHHLYHTIQTSKLDQTISKIHRPNVRYSKRLIELFKSEYNLNKLKQYDEAIKVRRMIDKLLPLEEKRFYDEFERGIEMRRKKLADAQAEDDRKFDENLKKQEWKDIRRREQELWVTEQRVKNHTKDMTHSHLLESKLKAEMSVKPSELWKHRPGYDTSAASLRGQQLTDVVREKKVGTQVFAESLVNRHDYVNVPLNTITLSSTTIRRTQLNMNNSDFS